MSGVSGSGNYRGRTLVDVLADLDNVIHAASNRGRAIGIFPARYRSVTAEMHDAVRSGFFDDNARLERLAVVFADHYLDALHRWQSGNRLPDAWKVAFLLQFVLAELDYPVARKLAMRPTKGEAFWLLPPDL